MAERCGCHDQGDETVFGQCRQCHPEPESVDLFGALIGAIERARAAKRDDFTLSPPEPESVHASGLQRELDRLERACIAVAEMPWETTLGEGARDE